jgi:CRP-like cAMP-binding protein
MDPSHLQDVELFASLTDDERTHLAAQLEERHAEPGEHLTLSGASGYFFFVILAGTAAVEHDGSVVAQLGPNDFFGETAILEHKRRTATVTAASPMTLAVMFGADFGVLLRDHPDIGSRIQDAMRRRAEDTAHT